MPFQKYLIPLSVAVLLAISYISYGWPGLALVGGGVVMWLLLHFNRTMQALKRAADRPMGFVPSAVMLNAKLKPGVTLLHVIAMTRSLGLLLSPKDVQPEIYRWSDEDGSYVTCTFQDGKLVSWEMYRPPEEPPSPPDLPPVPAPVAPSDPPR